MAIAMADVVAVHSIWLSLTMVYYSDGAGPGTYPGGWVTISETVGWVGE
jgi:hypothetical protein